MSQKVAEIADVTTKPVKAVQSAGDLVKLLKGGCGDTTKVLEEIKSGAWCSTVVRQGLAPGGVRGGGVAGAIAATGSR
ncbi:hypothetical protein ABT324_33180 [Saccharopolyspora sp. NPDC000359]|uniref:hypothetical protein n=1 Tax=Saccharopolyspora sp. NPDC000359 TaxID=3154251 RepID=UPI00331EA1C1